MPSTLPRRAEGEESVVTDSLSVHAAGGSIIGLAAIGHAHL
jgi:hypothetical protein